MNPFGNFYQRDFFLYKAMKSNKYLQLIAPPVISVHTLKDYALITLGSLILAIGYGIFIVPHNIVPGGIFGLSIVINQLINLPIGTIALCINIPLLLWGTRILGKKTGIKTAFSMITVSVFIDSVLAFTNKAIIVNDILVSSIFGGVLIGLAVVIVMKAGATTGGNDILVRILSKYIHLPFNQLILIIDALIVSIGVFIFGDFTLSAYCVIAIITISQTISHFLQKEVENKTLLVFSEQNETLQQTLKPLPNAVERSIEHIHLDSSNKLILVVKNNKKVSHVKALIKDIDPKAYIVQINSNQTEH